MFLPRLPRQAGQMLSTRKQTRNRQDQQPGNLSYHDTVGKTTALFAAGFKFLALLKSVLSSK